MLLIFKGFTMNKSKRPMRLILLGTGIAGLSIMAIAGYFATQEKIVSEVLMEEPVTGKIQKSPVADQLPAPTISKDKNMSFPGRTGSVMALRREFKGEAVRGKSVAGYAEGGSGGISVTLGGLMGGGGGSISYGMRGKAQGMGDGYAAYSTHNTEEFTSNPVSSWKDVAMDPLSTFSIDVDRAGYSIVRRLLNEGRTPPTGAVRLEELVNYFDYSYPAPQDGKPFTVHTNIIRCPWNPDHLLARVAMQARRMETSKLPPSNFVFLLDVSGSMQDPDKLPLLQESMKLLVANLRAQDRVAIVVYAGNSGLVLESTPGNQKQAIIEAIDHLHAGGSTNGVGGITQAYQEALQNFLPNGNNRIIWATDGDFNVGLSSTDGLVGLVEEKRKQGVFLTVLGVGMGNYKDGRLEQIADNGNGNYSYIDNIQEAKKVLVQEFSGSLFTMAKDVKLQVEFNPGKVKRWKQLGYENRALANADFTNDKKDAGELGTGHSVTAFYEIEPTELDPPSGLEAKAGEPFRYQRRETKEGAVKNEWMLVKARYKEPKQDVSIPLEWALSGSPLEIGQSSESMQFAVGVLCFAKKLRQEEDAKVISWQSITERLSKSLGPDANGDRAEFLSLVHKAERTGSRIGAL